MDLMLLLKRAGAFAGRVAIRQFLLDGLCTLFGADLPAAAAAGPADAGAATGAPQALNREHRPSGPIARVPAPGLGGKVAALLNKKIEITAQERSCLHPKKSRPEDRVRNEVQSPDATP